MARNGAEVLVKRNSKLEAFLKRNLDVDTFNRVRCHESCIVCSDTEDKAFKFVVLSDEWIYLTENPPKKVQPVVHLGDVLSVELLNEFPEFLSGEERECCQHVVVKYLTEAVKDKKKKKGDVSPRGSGSLTARSSGSTTARSNGPLSARYSIASSSKGDEPQLPFKARSLKEKGNPKEEDPKRSNSADDIQLAASPKARKGRKTRRKSKDVGDEVIYSQSTTSNLASTLRNSYTSSDYLQARERNRPLPNPADEWDEDGDLIDKRKKEPLKLSYTPTGELRLALDKLDDENSDVSEKEDESESQSKSGKKTKGKKFGLSSKEGKKAAHGAAGDSLKADAASLTESDGVESQEEEPELVPTSLHLYILKYSSPVLMLMRAAWNNYLIRGTLQLDEEYQEKTSSLYSPRSTNEKLSMLFVQLKGELLDPLNSMEVNFALLHELKVATERNTQLKHIFWRTPDVFIFLVNQLQLYLPTPRNPLNAILSVAKGERADQLEYINLIIETLALVLRETEINPARIQVLKTHKGKSVRDLVIAITCAPTLPKPPGEEEDGKNERSPIHGPKLTLSNLATENSEVTNVELKKLLHEMTDFSTALLYELILIAHNANWGDQNGSFLNICWLMKILDELNTTEHFLERLVNETFRHILPTAQSDELTPEQSILVFQQFSVLQTFIEYSPRMTKFIRNNFYEEFKYYIQAPFILNKLPPSYPIAPYVIKLIEEVMSEVLEKTGVLRLELRDHYQQLVL